MPVRRWRSIRRTNTGSRVASLGHTDPMGKVDLPDYPLTRNYFVSSHQHGGAGNASSKGLCQQFGDPLNSAPIQRALFIALDQWADQGVAPPPSQVPKLVGRDARAPAAPERHGLSQHPGRHLHRSEDDAVPVQLGFEVRQRRHQGQSIRRRRSSPLEDNAENRSDLSDLCSEDRRRRQRHRRHSFARCHRAARNLCGLVAAGRASGPTTAAKAPGRSVPFAQTKAARMASGDPRLSIEERYTVLHGRTTTQLLSAIDNMVQQRYMLPEDAPTSFISGPPKGSGRRLDAGPEGVRDPASAGVGEHQGRAWRRP